MSQTPVKYSVGFSMPCSCRAKVETESEPKFEDCKDRVSGQLLLLLLLLPFKESMSSHLNLNSVPLKWNSDWGCVLCRNMYAAYWWETVEHIQFAKISQCARNKAMGHIAAWYWSVMGLFFFFRLCGQNKLSSLRMNLRTKFKLFKVKPLVGKKHLQWYFP